MSYTYINFKTKEGHTFPVELKVARMSKVIAKMIDNIAENDDDESPVELSRISTDIFLQVLKWAEHHKDDPQTPEDEQKEYYNCMRTNKTSSWDKKFLDEMDGFTLFSLIMAAKFLDIQGLVDLTTKPIADIIKGNTPQEIRRLFHIKNDFTPEEEEQIRREIEWCS